MNPILASTLAVGLLYLYDRYNHCVKQFYKYLMLFFFLTGCLYTHRVIASEIDFHPTGVRRDWIGADGLPNDKCIDAIKRSNHKQTEEGINRFAEWAYDYRMQLEDKCWYLPRLSDADKAKLGFTSCMALFPGPIYLKAGLAFLNFATQYGLHYIQEWDEIEHLTRQMMWASRCCEIYVEHAREQGWIN